MKNKSANIYVGRRKRSVARVRLLDGKGDVIINKRSLKDYFVRDFYQIYAIEPIKLVEKDAKYDIFVNVKGGGLTGQAGAIRMGIARALQGEDETLRPQLKKAGMLTRDDREVERKKYGRKKARKSFQFSKR